MSTQDTVNFWTKIDHTERQPAIYHFPDTDKDDGGTVTRYTYNNLQQGMQVVLYEVKNGGHTEPSREEKYRWLYKLIVGKQNHDIEMADEVWAFFRDKHR